MAITVQMAEQMGRDARVAGLTTMMEDKALVDYIGGRGGYIDLKTAWWVGFRGATTAAATAVAPIPVAVTNTVARGSICRKCGGPCADGSGNCGEC